MKKFAVLKQSLVMTEEEIKAYNDLPKNMPETVLTKKQKELVESLYYKYLSGKITAGWGRDLYEIEKKEKWPSGPRVKTHEAMRFILGNLVDLQNQKELTTKQAAEKFYHCMNCRESYTVLLQKAYELKQN